MSSDPLFPARFSNVICLPVLLYFIWFLAIVYQTPLMYASVFYLGISPRGTRHSPYGIKHIQYSLYRRVRPCKANGPLECVKTGPCARTLKLGLIVKKPVVSRLRRWHHACLGDRGDGNRGRKPARPRREHGNGRRTAGGESRDIDSVWVDCARAQRTNGHEHGVADEFGEVCRRFRRAAFDRSVHRKHRGEQMAGMDLLELLGTDFSENGRLVKLQRKVRSSFPRSSEIDDKRKPTL